MYANKIFEKEVVSEDRIINNLEEDLIQNEPTTEEDEKRALEEIKNHIERCTKKEIKIGQKVAGINEISVLLESLMIGSVALQEIKGKEKIDIKTIESLILQINKRQDLVQGVANNVRTLYDMQQKKKNLIKKEKQVENIVEQLEEKVDPLVEIDRPFEKLEINNLHGRFHPEKDEKTGKITFMHKLEIPEFSAKRGEVIFLSGKSGRGKSTFIKLLKKGDKDNRNFMTIDGEQQVDKLGKQFIALNPDKELRNSYKCIKTISGKGCYF